MPLCVQFSSKSANQFVMCNMTNSAIAQSDKLCSPIKASIDVCLVRVPRGLRVELCVPPDLDRLHGLIGWAQLRGSQFGSHNTFYLSMLFTPK